MRCLPKNYNNAFILSLTKGKRVAPRKTFLIPFHYLYMKKLLTLASIALILGACTPVAEEPLSFTPNLDNLAWQSEQTGTTENGEPITEVTLVDTSTNTVLARTNCMGTLSAYEPTDTAPLASHLYVRCWWMGGGYDYTVTAPADAITAVRRSVDEELGFGPWEEFPAPAGKRAAMEWRFEQTGTAEYDMPITKLTLVVSSTDVVLYQTTCNGTASIDVQDVEGSVASIQCWWAGGGDQYGVFITDAEVLTVRHRTVDEEAGFGPWEEAQ